MAYDASNGGNSQLPVSKDQILQNMRAAVPARRGAAGVNYVRIDCRTGAITFGRDEIPLPLDHQYAVPWREVKWGYKEFTGRSVTNSVLRPVAAGPCPHAGRRLRAVRRRRAARLHGAEGSARSPSRASSTSSRA